MQSSCPLFCAGCYSHSAFVYARIGPQPQRRSVAGEVLSIELSLRPFMVKSLKQARRRFLRKPLLHREAQIIKRMKTVVGLPAATIAEVVQRDRKSVYNAFVFVQGPFRARTRPVRGPYEAHTGPIVNLQYVDNSVATKEEDYMYRRIEFYRAAQLV